MTGTDESAHNGAGETGRGVPVLEGTGLDGAPPPRSAAEAAPSPQAPEPEQGAGRPPAAPPEATAATAASQAAPESNAETAGAGPGTRPAAERQNPACPSCGAEVMPEDGFCEACGADLLVRRAAPPDTALAPCPDCGGTAFSDGYCDNCGRLAPSPRDHVERDLGTVAGITDRGLRHSRNEDAMAFAVLGSPAGEPTTVIVVCDGVSTSADPHRASQLAADTALEQLVLDLRGGAPAFAATSGAIDAAQDAVTALAEEYPDRSAAPSCTIVTAVLQLGRITVGWVGDSRVYWLAADTAASRRLTDDDTWAGQLISGGAVDEAEAYKAPHAHAILRWLGPDAPAEPPHVQDFAPDGPGLVLACSDGLWNYVWDAPELARLAREGGSLAAGAAALTAVALDGGGQDNITAVLGAYPPDQDLPPAAASGPRAGAGTDPLAQTMELEPSDEGSEP